MLLGCRIRHKHIIMDSLQMAEVDLIVSMQKSYELHSELLLFLSHLGDPRNAFLVYFPLAYFCHRDVGVKVVWAGALAEWVNALLKWVMFGERPYWWVHSSPVYTDDSRPHVEQYRLTCETGPGSPSGHAMVTSAVWFLMIRSLISHSLDKHPRRSVLSVALGLAFLVAMFLVSASRCFIAAHFPHQVVLGTVVGTVLGELVHRAPTHRASLIAYSVTTATVLAAAPATNWLVQALGSDPSWSVTLAKAWCARPEWVYLDTTPYFAVTRDASMLLGTGLALWCLQKLNPNNSDLKQNTESSSGLLSATLIVVSVAFTRGLEYVRIPQHSLAVFYSLAFCRYLILPTVVMCLLPLTLGQCFPGSKVKAR